MYQAKSGKKPPKAMAAALEAFQEGQLMQIAVGVSNTGGLIPRNLKGQQRKAVAEMVRNINAARRRTI